MLFEVVCLVDWLDIDWLTRSSLVSPPALAERVCVGRTGRCQVCASRRTLYSRRDDLENKRIAVWHTYVCCHHGRLFLLLFLLLLFLPLLLLLLFLLLERNVDSLVCWRMIVLELVRHLTKKNKSIFFFSQTQSNNNKKQTVFIDIANRRWNFILRTKFMMFISHHITCIKNNVKI